MNIFYIIFMSCIHLLNRKCFQNSIPALSSSRTSREMPILSASRRRTSSANADAKDDGGGVGVGGLAANRRSGGELKGAKKSVSTVGRDGYVVQCVAVCCGGFAVCCSVSMVGRNGYVFGVRSVWRCSMLQCLQYVTVCRHSGEMGMCVSPYSVMLCIMFQRVAVCH